MLLVNNWLVKSVLNCGWVKCSNKSTQCKDKNSVHPEYKFKILNLPKQNKMFKHFRPLYVKIKIEYL